jgi:PAS domain S-box-containing protein
VIREAHEAMDFMANVLGASTEYSIIGKDLDGKILLWNEGARRMYGYEPEEVVAKTSSEILGEELIGTPFADHFMDSEQATAQVNKTFEKGIVTDYVLTLARRDRRQLQVSFNASVFKDPSGDVRSIFASARDITAQKQLEAQLQASQTYTRSLIESNIDALMTIDPLDIISDVNQQMEVLTGFSREEVMGTPFKTYFADPQRAEDKFESLLTQIPPVEDDLEDALLLGETLTDMGAAWYELTQAANSMDCPSP